MGGKHAEPQSPNPLLAGIVLSHKYIDLMGEGKIIAKPEIERLEGSTVHFTDGSSVEADIVVQVGVTTPDSLPMLLVQLMPCFWW